MIARALRFLVTLTALLLIGATTKAAVFQGAAVFPGNARLESSAADSTSTLTWNNATNALTVACWFKISVPSDFNLTEDMAILVNNRTSSANNHAYAIYLSATTGNIEFTSRGSGNSATLPTTKLIEHPLIERW